MMFGVVGLLEICKGELVLRGGELRGKGLERI